MQLKLYQNVHLCRDPKLEWSTKRLVPKLLREMLTYWYAIIYMDIKGDVSPGRTVGAADASLCLSKLYHRGRYI
jgi:hypothetical protein